jgi:hypothetical protein
VRDAAEDRDVSAPQRRLAGDSLARLLVPRQDEAQPSSSRLGKRDVNRVAPGESGLT